MTETTEQVQMTDNGETRDPEKAPRSISLPVFMLTLLGTVITVLGLFAAGDLGIVIVGLASVAVAALIHVFGTRQ